MSSFGFSPRDKYEDLLRSGIIAAKNGSKRLARRLLEQAINARSGDARPWLWLAKISDDPDKKREYIEEAVAHDPHNPAARRRLALLNGKLQPDEILPQGEGVQASSSDDPVAAKTEKSFACPQCGGMIEFNIQRQQVHCPYCGYEQTLEQGQRAEATEQVLDFVLPTQRGHQWAENQRQLSCQNCGAVSLWAIGQRATQCPYCQSNQLIEAKESIHLVDPQVIGLLEIDEKQAFKNAEAWLDEEGWFSPDNLETSARKMTLRPAYYPFWTLDGTLEIRWQCDVMEGSGDNARWVRRSGVELEIFDDELVPGNSSLSWQKINPITPFKVKQAVEFQPEYLAGWPALTYDIPLAKATLNARERVVKRVRRELHQRILPARKKQNLNVSAGRWSGMTFKHVLLPIWVGAYPYKGESYQILINGQTGKVGGEKPRDTVKTVTIILSVLLTIVVLLIFSFILAAEMGWIAL